MGEIASKKRQIFNHGLFVGFNTDYHGDFDFNTDWHGDFLILTRIGTEVFVLTRIGTEVFFDLTRISTDEM